MGTLLGHLMPGTFFLVLGVWWTFNIWSRYFQCLRSRRRFQSNLSFPLRSGSRVPWESVVIISCAIVGIVGEIVTGWRGDKLIEMGNGQHAAMYLMFGLFSAVEAARFTGLTLVPGLEYAFAVLACASEALLFAMHGNGTSTMEMMIHHLLLYTVLGSAVSVAVEALHRHSIMAALARCFFVLLQGTWFIQVGFILFPPDGWPAPWDVGSYRHQKLATVVFVLHWVGVLVAMTTLGLVLRWRSGLGLRTRDSSTNGRRPQQDATKLLTSSEDEF